MDDQWDCIVVGGGAAGLSAALVLGRARRRTLVVDAGHQSNRPAAGIGGLLGHDGRPPAELYALGRSELAAYPAVEVRDAALVVDAAADGDGTGPGFTVTLGDGRQERARRLLLAAGMDYRHPDLPGVAERWGASVFHCPFCHGWEVRDRTLAVLDGEATGPTRAQLLRAWSDDVTLLTDGPTNLSAADLTALAAAGVEVDERPVVGLDGPAPDLRAVRFADGTERACGGLMVPAPLHVRSPLAAALGAEAAPPSPMATGSLRVDALGHTSVPGLFAAGDVAADMPSVANAVAAGSRAAAGVVHSLLVPTSGA